METEPVLLDNMGPVYIQDLPEFLSVLRLVVRTLCDTEGIYII